MYHFSLCHLTSPLSCTIAHISLKNLFLSSCDITSCYIILDLRAVGINITADCYVTPCNLWIDSSEMLLFASHIPGHHNRNRILVFI